jgi:hypothetical protein
VVDGTVLALEGVCPDGEAWALLYAPRGERGHRHHLALVVNGSERESGSGFDIPETTEIGFGGALTPGSGNFYLYGLTSDRIRTVCAESLGDARRTEAMTSGLPLATAEGADSLRFFVLVRPPVEDVIALVGLDRAGHQVQRIPLPGPPGRP